MYVVLSRLLEEEGWCDSRKNNTGHLITTVVGVLLPPAVEVVLVPGDQVGAPAVRERCG